jgi:hypothetical protein
MRRAGRASVTARPASSVTVMPPDGGARFPVPHAVAMQARKPARWVRCAQRRIAKRPTPDGAEMGERLRRDAQRHHPSREGSAGGANGEVSWLRASGPPSREQYPVALSRYTMPVTVAGPRRIRTGFRESPFACNYEA